MVPKETFIQESVKQVLIVDNNKDLLESLKVGLDKYSHAFTTVLANDGEQALDILREKPISVVVSDVKMPKMNGLSLTIYPMHPFKKSPVSIRFSLAVCGSSTTAAFCTKPKIICRRLPV